MHRVSRNNHRRSFTTLALVTCLVITACTAEGNGGVTSTASQSEQTTTPATGPGDAILTVGTTQQINSFDPADTVDALGNDAVANFTAPLYRPIGFELVPHVAKDLPERSEDGLTYTIRLREDVLFGDGLPLTAPLYVQQFQRNINLGGTISAYRITPFVESVEATDEFTIVFHLNEPFAFFEKLLGYSAYGVSHPDIFPEDEIAKLPEAPIYGTGAYILTDYDPSGDRLIFEPNPHYFGEPSAWSQVIYRVYPDPQTMGLALRSGEIDVAWRLLDEEQLASLRTDPEFTVGNASQNIFFLFVNHKMAPSDDSRVNQAVAAIINRDEVVDRAFGGTMIPLYGQVPPDEYGGTEPFKTNFNPPNVELAIELLEEAGYSRENPVRIQMATSTAQLGQAATDATVIMAEQLNATGYFDVEVTDGDFATYFSAIMDGESYNYSLMNKTTEPDPELYLGVFITNQGVGTFITDDANNPTRPEYEPLVEQLALAAKIEDPDEREEAYATLGDMWANHVVTIPTWLDPLEVSYRNTVVRGNPDLPNAEALGIPFTEVVYFNRIQPVP